MVSQLLELVKTVSRPSCVWRPEICREEAEDADQGDFILDDLIPALLWRKDAEVLMAPRVAANVVTFEVHALDEVRVSCPWVLDLTLASVGADHEEGRLHVVPLEQIEQLRCVDVWAVVKGQGNLPRDGTMADARSIHDTTKERARNRRSVFPLRRLVAVTGRSKG